MAMLFVNTVRTLALSLPGVDGTLQPGPESVSAFVGPSVVDLRYVPFGKRRKADRPSFRSSGTTRLEWDV